MQLKTPAWGTIPEILLSYSHSFRQAEGFSVNKGTVLNPQQS